MSLDQLYRFTFTDLDIRGELVVLEEAWQAIAGRDAYPDPVRKLLGEALAAVSILSATIKYQGSLILQIQGQGPCRTLVVQATDTGNLRGLARWQGEVTEAPPARMFGQGQMAITLASPGKEPHQSIVGLDGRNLSELLEHYFLNSEQLDSSFWLFTGEKRVAGLFLQQLPAQKPDREDWDRINMLATTTSAGEILTLPPEQMLHRLFHEENLTLFEPESLKFCCNCSREKIANTLFIIGRSSLEEVLEEKGKIEVQCEFCNENYIFNPEQVNSLFSVPTEQQLH